MRTHNLGYPRIGGQRQLKKACEQYWAGKIDVNALKQIGSSIREQNWQTQLEAGIDLIPCNDFSLYDQILDTSLLLGAVPERYAPLVSKSDDEGKVELYFAMARGYQNGLSFFTQHLSGIPVGFKDIFIRNIKSFNGS